MPQFDAEVKHPPPLLPAQQRGCSSPISWLLPWLLVGSELSNSHSLCPGQRSTHPEELPQHRSCKASTRHQLLRRLLHPLPRE